MYTVGYTRLHGSASHNEAPRTTHASTAIAGLQSFTMPGGATSWEEEEE